MLLGNNNKSEEIIFLFDVSIFLFLYYSVCFRRIKLWSYWSPYFCSLLSAYILLIKLLLEHLEVCWENLNSILHPLSATIISPECNSPVPTIIFEIFWDFLVFYKISFSLQVKQCAIISHKRSMYELLLINVVCTSYLTSCRTT